MPLASLLHRLAVAASVLAVSAATLHAAGPSFDCARETGEVEQAICRSASLSALDARIAGAYRALMTAWKDQPEARDELRRAQRDFLERRADALRGPDGALGRLHQDQLALLSAIETTPRPSFEGRWGKLSGQVKIRREAAGEAIWGAAVEPVRFRWICEIDARGRSVDGVFVSPAEAGTPGFAEWSLRIERIGPLAQLREYAPPGGHVLPDGSSGEQRPYCGHNGRFDGVYFPLRPEAAR